MYRSIRGSGFEWWRIYISIFFSKFLNRIFRHCVGGIIQSVQQRVRIRLLKRLKRSICHVTSDIKQSITRNRLVLHYSRSVKRCYGYYRLVLRGATLCFPIIEMYFVPSVPSQWFEVTSLIPGCPWGSWLHVFCTRNPGPVPGLVSEPLSVLIGSGHMGKIFETYEKWFIYFVIYIFDVVSNAIYPWVIQ